MKLRELFDQQTDEMIGVKKFHDMTADEVRDLLANEYGMKDSGEGAFGKVLQSKDPNVVYKVFEYDAPYLAFIEFAKQHPNIHFPKIYKVKNITSFYKRYDIQPDKFYVVAIEKLNKINKKFGFSIEFIENVLNLNTPESYTLTMPGGAENKRMIPLKTFMQAFPSLRSLWEAGRIIEKWRADTFGHFGDVFSDIHTGNIMQRDDGTIVVIDPVASQSAMDYQLELKRKKQSNKDMVKGPHYNKTTVPSDDNEFPYHQPSDDTIDRWAQADDEWADRPSAKKKLITSTQAAKAEFDQIMKKSYRTTADLERARDLTDFLDKAYNGSNSSL